MEPYVCSKYRSVTYLYEKTSKLVHVWQKKFISGQSFDSITFAQLR